MSPDGPPFYGYDLDGIRIPVHGSFGLVPDPAPPPVTLDLSQATQVQHSYDFYDLGEHRTLIFYNDAPTCGKSRAAWTPRRRCRGRWRCWDRGSRGSAPWGPGGAPRSAGAARGARSG